MKIISMKTVLALSVISLLLSDGSARAATVVGADEDVMTSGFFTGTNRVRGYSVDGRATHRTSTKNPFGTVAAETIYLTFDYDFESHSGGPVSKAILSMESVSGGFGADASTTSPFLVSAHGVTADPLSSITDDTNPTGPIAWNTFYANNILEADAAARTSVTGFGTVEFDVTALVNSWIAGGNNVHAIALTGNYDSSGKNFLHGFKNNSDAPGSSKLTLVPEPSSLLLCSIGGLGMLVRRRRRV